MGKDNEEGFTALKPSDPKLVKELEMSITYSKWVLLENVGLDIDPALEPLLLKQTRREGGSLVI